jgi:hypothetical protein
MSGGGHSFTLEIFLFTSTQAEITSSKDFRPREGTVASPALGCRAHSGAAPDDANINHIHSPDFNCDHLRRRFLPSAVILYSNESPSGRHRSANPHWINTFVARKVIPRMGLDNARSICVPPCALKGVGFMRATAPLR